MPRNRQLKGAILGFGQVAAKAHAPAFRDHAAFSIIAVADERPERLDAARAFFPEVRTYPDLATMLAKEPELDFVDIATPPFLHARQVLEVLGRDRHVLCEKPLTLDPGDFARIKRTSARKNKAVFTVHNWKHSPLFSRLIAIVRAGAVGAVDHVELHTLRRAPAGSAHDDWRTDAARACGGILVDHGWHNLYLLRALVGQTPTRVVSRITRPGRPNGAPALARGAERSAEDQATVFFEFPAAGAILHLSWRARERSNRGVLYGSAGMIEINDDELVVRGRRAARWRFAEKISQASAHPEWFKACLGDFLREIGGDRTNIEEAEFCLRTLGQIYRPRGGLLG